MGLVVLSAVQSSVSAEISAWELPTPSQPPTAQQPTLGRILAEREPLPKPDGVPTAADAARSGTRGPEAIAVYDKAAPAVVYITDGATGHGTGFVIESDGWILTNNHVVEDMPYSAEHGAQTARVVYGKRTAAGYMEAQDGYLEAIVYRRDKRRDLALLKLLKLPVGIEQLPTIAVSKQAPPQGENCFAIGHPSSGVLWTLRTGIIAGRGKFPHDRIGNFLKGTDQVVRQRIGEQLAGVPSCVVTLSSCGVNPGDSGGPLLNEKGELVAVTFAIPANVRDKSFSYHIHLDEVQAFLKQRPSSPELVPPTAEFEAEYVTLEDLDDDKIPDVRLFLAEPKAKPSGLQFDLNGDSISRRKKPATSKKLFVAEQDEASLPWDFEFAISIQPTPTLFYDTDDDRTIDLIVLPRQKTRLVNKSDGWRVEVATDVPSKPFTRPELNDRYRKITGGLGILEDEK